MKFYTGKFDGQTVLRISQCKGLVVLDRNRFAVLKDHYSGGASPYLALESSGDHVVTLDGHVHAGSAAPAAATYDIYRRTGVSLPNTCIESAEHVIKCLHANAHQTGLIANGTGARVSMSVGTQAADIDVADMNETAAATFRGRISDATPDACSEAIAPGDGMALVFTSQRARPDNLWTVHAVAVLLKSTWPFDRFMVVSEVFAPDDGRGVRMIRGWSLGFYVDPQDFKESYAGVMPSAQYTLWKLSAAAR